MFVVVKTIIVYMRLRSGCSLCIAFSEFNLTVKATDRIAFRSAELYPTPS